MARGSVRARVRAQAQAQGLEQALALGLARETATAWLREQTGKDRRFQSLMLRWPQSPEIPLIAKSVERWTKSSPCTLPQRQILFTPSRGASRPTQNAHPNGRAALPSN